MHNSLLLYHCTERGYHICSFCSLFFQHRGRYLQPGLSQTTSILAFCTLAAPMAPLSETIPGSEVLSSRDPGWVYTMCLIVGRDQAGNVFCRTPSPAGGNPASHQDGCTLHTASKQLFISPCRYGPELTICTISVFLSSEHMLHKLQSTNKVYFMIKEGIDLKKKPKHNKTLQKQIFQLSTHIEYDISKENNQSNRRSIPSRTPAPESLKSDHMPLQ